MFDFENVKKVVLKNNETDQDRMAKIVGADDVIASGNKVNAGKKSHDGFFWWFVKNPIRSIFAALITLATTATVFYLSPYLKSLIT